MSFPTPFTLPTISFIGGSTQTFTFPAYFAKTNEQFDLSSCKSIVFSVADYVNPYGGPVIRVDMDVLSEDTDDDGVSVPSVLKATLSPAKTRGLSGKFIYQLEITDVEGNVEIPNQGIMHIFRNINTV